jgi:predicted Fe-Mo cluster-binding NifX family protein
MKVAIATDGTEVAAHFGRCEAYTVAEIEDGQIVAREVVANPGHEPGFLPGYLAKRGVTCIVAGGMGPRAVMLFEERQIQAITGVTGPVEDTLGALLRGELEGGESLCEH